jgi:hypothetical protein
MKPTHLVPAGCPPNKPGIFGASSERFAYAVGKVVFVYDTNTFAFTQLASAHTVRFALVPVSREILQ